jgi:spermidine synthase
VGKVILDKHASNTMYKNKTRTEEKKANRAAVSMNQKMHECLFVSNPFLDAMVNRCINPVTFINAIDFISFPQNS